MIPWAAVIYIMQVFILFLVILFTTNLCLHISERSKAKKTMAPFQLCERHETVPIKTDGKKFFSRKNFDGNHLISVLDKDDMFLSEINQWLADHPELLITKPPCPHTWHHHK